MLLGSILFYLKKKLKNTVHGSQWLRSNADDEDSKVSNLVSLLRFDKLFVNLLFFVIPPLFFLQKIEYDYYV